MWLEIVQIIREAPKKALKVMLSFVASCFHDLRTELVLQDAALLSKAGAWAQGNDNA